MSWCCLSPKKGKLCYKLHTWHNLKCAIYQNWYYSLQRFVFVIVACEGHAQHLWAIALWSEIRIVHSVDPFCIIVTWWILRRLHTTHKKVGEKIVAHIKKLLKNRWSCEKKLKCVWKITKFFAVLCVVYFNELYHQCKWVNSILNI